MIWMQIIDYTAVAVFAATGALLAARQNLDIIGFIFLAGITGIGGGTLRDIILDLPVFWINNTTYILICTCVAIAIYFSACWVESQWKCLLWFDAIGMSVFSATGAAKGLLITHSPVLAIFTGILTATFGGILRDIVAGQPSVLLRQDIYVSAAALGSFVYVIIHAITGQNSLSIFFAFLAAFLLRSLALWFGLSLPAWKKKFTT